MDTHPGVPAVGPTVRLDYVDEEVEKAVQAFDAAVKSIRAARSSRPALV